MNAGRFQIAVHDAGFVRRLEAARARRADRQIGNVPVEVVQRATQTRLPDDLLRLSPGSHARFSRPNHGAAVAIALTLRPHRPEA